MFLLLLFLLKKKNNNNKKEYLHDHADEHADRKRIQGRSRHARKKKTNKYVRACLFV